MKTALQIVQSACLRMGLNKPTAALGSTDAQVQQLVELLQEEGRELAGRYEWQALTKEASFTTVATETQGALETIAPRCRYIVNETIWDRTLRRPVFGPLSKQAWQQLKAQPMQGPWWQYRIRGGNIIFIPVPTAGDSCYFEYISRNWCVTADGSTEQEDFGADDDVPLLEDNLLLHGLVWRWKAARGFEYSEDYNKYERLVADAMARDGSKQVLNMSGTHWEIQPGIIVPSGSWNV